MTRISVVALAFILSGCLSPYILSGSEDKVMVGDVNLLNHREFSQQVADAHCQIFGRSAKLDQAIKRPDDYFRGGTQTYDCVK